MKKALNEALILLAIAAIIMASYAILDMVAGLQDRWSVIVSVAIGFALMHLHRARMRRNPDQ